jgi:hypothetical protein
MLLVVLIGSAIILVSCRRSLPEAYGVYADTDHGQLVLQGQVTRVAGNILRPIPGLIGPSGAACGSVKDFIVFKKDVHPDSLGLTRLSFVGEANIPGFVGVTRGKINLWLPQEQIGLQVKPVEERRDMYIVSPSKPLGKGFYALYIGSFAGEMGMGAIDYDIVVGSVKDFPSYAAAVTSAEDQFKSNAAALLAKMNGLLDRRDYSHLEGVYRPGGRVLAGAELQNFVTGNQTWLESSGRIVKSEISGVSLMNNGTAARCSVRTTYEKAGVQEESVTITKIGREYFITEVR